MNSDGEEKEVLIDVDRKSFKMTHYLNFTQLIDKLTQNHVNYSDIINIESLLFDSNSHFAIYHANLGGSFKYVKVNLDYIRDYALITCDNKHLYTFNRLSKLNYTQIKLKLPSNCQKFYVFTENMGRLSGYHVNKFILFNEKKGVLNRNAFKFDNIEIVIKKWFIYTLNINKFSNLFSINSQWNRVVDDKKHHINGPIMFYSRLNLNLNSNEDKSRRDYFLRLSNKWTKGIVVVNDFVLGRYWSSAGPLCSLHIPNRLLLNGMNELFLIEFESTTSIKIEITNRQEYSPCTESEFR